MNIQLKSFALGFITACLVGLGSIVGLLFLGTSDTMVVHDQVLPSGKNIKISMCNFAWGVEHDERFPDKDCFVLQYVSSMPAADQQTRDQEAVDVFELIRPVSEQWGMNKAEVSAFPAAKRKGNYDIYFFTHNADGKWTFTREAAKVHIND